MGMSVGTGTRTVCVFEGPGPVSNSWDVLLKDLHGGSKLNNQLLHVWIEFCQYCTMTSSHQGKVVAVTDYYTQLIHSIQDADNGEALVFPFPAHEAWTTSFYAKVVIVAARYCLGLLLLLLMTTQTGQVSH